MAKRVEQITLGIDVSKTELAVYHWEQEWQGCVANEPAAIRKWLKSLYGPVRIAIEPTSNYHLTVIEQAIALRIEVYLVQDRQLVYYREAVSRGNKTDPGDAWLLARFLAREADQLRPYRPQCPQAQQLWTLLKRRALVVGARKQLQQSFSTVAFSVQALWSEMQRVIQRLEQRILALIKALGWSAAYERCRSIPGIGELNAAALTAAYHRGAFASADAFVAFLGLDVRIRQSGKYKGKRKLTKRGEAEMRRLLYCAAKPSRSHPRFDAYYQRQLEKGLPKIAANVILGRKLARIAFTLMRNEQTFDHHHREACIAP